MNEQWVVLDMRDEDMPAAHGPFRGPGDLGERLARDFAKGLWMDAGMDEDYAERSLDGLSDILVLKMKGPK